MRIDRQEQKFLEEKKIMLDVCVVEFVFRVRVKQRENKALSSSNRPGLRGSHILRIGSEPPAATRAELSPPISRQLRALPQNCMARESYHLNFQEI